MNGLHLLGDLYGCRCKETLIIQVDPLRQICIDFCKDAGLTVVGESFIQFEKGGITGVVVLAESHLAIHTWPEIKSVTIDLYVCNYSGDNSQKAKELFEAILNILEPEHVLRKIVFRGQLSKIP